MVALTQSRFFLAFYTNAYKISTQNHKCKRLVQCTIWVHFTWCMVCIFSKYSNSTEYMVVANFRQKYKIWVRTISTYSVISLLTSPATVELAFYEGYVHFRTFPRFMSWQMTGFEMTCMFYTYRIRQIHKQYTFEKKYIGGAWISP